MDWLMAFYLGGVVATLCHFTWTAYVNEDWRDLRQCWRYVVVALLWPATPAFYVYEAWRG